MIAILLIMLNTQGDRGWRLRGAVPEGWPAGTTSDQGLIWGWVGQRGAWGTWGMGGWPAGPAPLGWLAGCSARHSSWLFSLSGHLAYIYILSPFKTTLKVH